jgi:hypothetical protein
MYPPVYPELWKAKSNKPPKEAMILHFGGLSFADNQF